MQIIIFYKDKERNEIVAWFGNGRACLYAKKKLNSGKFDAGDRRENHWSNILEWAKADGI